MFTCELISSESLFKSVVKTLICKVPKYIVYAKTATAINFMNKQVLRNWFKGDITNNTIINIDVNVQKQIVFVFKANFVKE